MKISAKTKDCRLLLKVKSSFRENFNTQEVDRFARAYLRCFLKPRIVKSNVLEYSGPVGISLQERLKKDITKRDFLFILEYIVIAVQKLNANDFPLYNLKMDTQHIFMNEATKELQFLYVPMIGVSESVGVIDLLNSLIYSARPAQEKDTEYVARFNYFFKSLKPFDLNKIEQFVQREDRTVVNTVKKHNSGQSGIMTSDRKSYYDHLDEQKKADDTALLEEEERTGLLADEDSAGYFDDLPTGLLNTADDEATGLLAEDDENTGLLAEEEEHTGLLDLEEEATGLLTQDDEEGTSLLVESPSIRYPTLLRVSTDETISVNKPVFRIGKERSYVDYFVTNNNAVSRSHADIITRETGYYVLDLNSKNRTYINNVPLEVQVETHINDGDTLRLGNEVFIFNVENDAMTLPVCPKCKSPIKHNDCFCSCCGTRI